MICAFIAEWRWVKVHRDLGRLNLEDPDDDCVGYLLLAVVLFGQDHSL